MFTSQEATIDDLLANSRLAKPPVFNRKFSDYEFVYYGNNYILTAHADFQTAAGAADSISATFRIHKIRANFRFCEPRFWIRTFHSDELVEVDFYQYATP